MSSPNPSAHSGITELLDLPVSEASRAYFETHNSRALAALLQFFAGLAVVAALALAVVGDWGRVAWPVADLLLIRLLFTLRRGEVWESYGRVLVLAFLVVQMALAHGLHLSYRPERPFHEELLFLPLLLLPFRWPPRTVASLLAPLWLAGSGRHLLRVFSGELEPAYFALLAQAVMILLVYHLIGDRRRRERREFVDLWRQESRRHREHLRIREELDDARRLQLSMLPRREPRLPWVELSSISLPASEVGGDYYDYFELEDGRLVVVIGDVAGHGLASSLLLSGIRSCLYLLQESSLRPVEILERLDRMVRKTTDDRIFVTLLYAVFDPAANRATFAAAGHPPPLHYRTGRGELVEHDLPALPLGTKLRGPLQEKEVAFEPGDVFALFTDGIAETTDADEETYGTERLQRHLHKACTRARAKEIRDSILGDVWRFKGDGRQLDDITVVVLKLK